MIHIRIILNMKTKDRAQLVEDIRNNFRCFGGGKYTEGNILSIALAEQKPQFAAGVDVEEVVRYVEDRIKKLNTKSRR